MSPVPLPPAATGRSLLVLATLAAAFAALLVVLPVDQLPSGVPGRDRDSEGHALGLAVLALAVSALSLIAAWVCSTPRERDLPNLPR